MVSLSLQWKYHYLIYLPVCQGSSFAWPSPSLRLDRPVDRHDVRRRAQLRKTTATADKLAAAQRLTPRDRLAPRNPGIAGRRLANCRQFVEFRVHPGDTKIPREKRLFQLVLMS